MERKGGDISTTAGVLKGNITEAIDQGVTGFRDINKNYAKAVSKQDVARKLTTLKGNISRDFAKGADRVEVLQRVSDDFGEEVADSLAEALQRESKISSNLRNLKNTAEKATVVKSGSRKLREATNVRNILGGAALGGAGVAGGAPAALGLAGTVGGAKLGLDALARRGAEKILPVARREISPRLISALSSTLGRETPSALTSILGERR
jgi:hypothetical protein